VVLCVWGCLGLGVGGPTMTLSLQIVGAGRRLAHMAQPPAWWLKERASAMGPGGLATSAAWRSVLEEHPLRLVGPSSIYATCPTNATELSTMEHVQCRSNPRVLLLHPRCRCNGSAMLTDAPWVRSALQAALRRADCGRFERARPAMAHRVRRG
jgi:hypothetical protein